MGFRGLQAALLASIVGVFSFSNSRADDGYLPTRLSSVNEAQALFNGLEGGLNGLSQCYKRAHVWSHSMYARNGVYSMKAFIFFSPSYQRRFDYEWWFHVAPMVYVGNQPYVLDPTFMDQAVSLTAWSNSFAQYASNGCSHVNSYQEYERERNYTDCVIMTVPMFYWQPLSIESRDKSGVLSTSWNDWEIKVSKRGTGANRIERRDARRERREARREARRRR